VNVSLGNPNSKLDLVLGVRWVVRLPAPPRARWAEVLTEIYVEQIRSLGYVEFDYERISLPTGRFLYKLIFCSKHKAGGRIWRNVARKKRDGQDTFDFDRP
jgi:hypothetical protein